MQPDSPSAVVPRAEKAMRCQRSRAERSRPQRSVHSALTNLVEMPSRSDKAGGSCAVIYLTLSRLLIISKWQWQAGRILNDQCRAKGEETPNVRCAGGVATLQRPSCRLLPA